MDARTGGFGAGIVTISGLPVTSQSNAIAELSTMATSGFHDLLVDAADSVDHVAAACGPPAWASFAAAQGSSRTVRSARRYDSDRVPVIGCGR